MSVNSGQASFRQRYEKEWAELRLILDGGQAGRQLEFPRRYRRLCQQLALARHRHYSADLLQLLNELTARAHHSFYARPDASAPQWHRILEAFPVAVRRDWRLALMGHLLFYGPFFAAFIAITLQPGLIHNFIDPATAAGVGEMYDPESERMFQERPSDSDLLMFGFYIRNNIGIAFRTFASGLLLGLGSVYFLVFNGLHIGAIAAYVTNIGHGGPFWSFVATHGAFELTAIALAGMAGLKLGLALLDPGRRTRKRALAEEARASVPILYGFTVLLVVAAFVEAFWSSSHTIPNELKYSAAAICWVAVYAYLLLGGRRDEA